MSSFGKRGAKMPPPIRTGPLAGVAPRPLKAQLKEVAYPALSYLGIVTMTYLAFLFVLATKPSRIAGEGFAFVVALGISTIGGVLLGQLLAVLRVRGWLMMGLWMLTWGLSCMVASAMLAAGPAMLIFVFMLYMFPYFMSGGYWSLRYRRDVFATWVPLIYTCAAVIIRIEDTGQVGAWFAGEKHGIWDFITVGILTFSLILLVVYLAVRERHFLVRWQQSPKALYAPELTEEGSTGQGLTWTGWAVAVVATLFIAGGTAFAAPYLWRTGPGERESDSDYGEPEPEPEPRETPGQSGLERVIEQIAEAIGNAVEAVAEAVQKHWPLLLVLVILFLLLLASIRPLRRILTVQHLRRGLWPVTPTQKIANLWRMIEVASADHGLVAKEEETASGFAARITSTLELSPALAESLAVMAGRRDRIAYGLGVSPEDLVAMEDSADAAYDGICAVPGRSLFRAYFRATP